MRVSERIRALTPTIAATWAETLRRHVPALGWLDRPTLIDDLPAILDALACWVDGDRPRAQTAFEALADGHARQRMWHGIDLGALTVEYQVLRALLLRSMLELEPTPDVRQDLIRMNEAMDEAVLQAVRRYVRAREDLRERFIGILGRDLRAPLQTVGLAFGRLHEEAADPAIAKVVDRGRRAVAHMDHMIKDLLDFARTQLGQGLPVRPTATDLGAICRAAVDDVRAEHPERRIVVTTRGDLRGFWDRDRVAQAIASLIANAIEHGGDPIDVCVLDDGPRVITEVKNPGPPIPDDVRAHLFEPFQRTPSSTGLGLGIYLVGAIARVHGAACDVESTAHTTTFRITWPRAQPQP